jgi:hypothetical protein
VAFVADEVALGQVSLRVFRPSPVSMNRRSVPVMDTDLEVRSRGRYFVPML